MTFESIQVNINKTSKHAGDIEAWLVNYVSQILSISPDKIDVNINLKSYGLDSSVIIALIAELSEYIGYELDPELLFEYSTISALANYCAGIEAVIL